jgi:DNA-binding MarR family transcriptional regulator
MAADTSPSESSAGSEARSQRERAVGLGPALRGAWIGYQRRLDRTMADAGFNERRFPDGRVLRLCSGSTGSTISNIGRELGITRQGAGKVVSHLEDRGYVSVVDSPMSRREKAVTLTVLGKTYLTAQHRAVRTIERQLRAELRTTQLGDEALDVLYQLLDVLDEGDGIRMRTYLQNTTVDFSAPHGARKGRQRNP